MRANNDQRCAFNFIEKRSFLLFHFSIFSTSLPKISSLSTW